MPGMMSATSPGMMNATAEFESLMAMNGDVGGVAPRWARKENGDRFIPSRRGLETAHHALSKKENRDDDDDGNLTRSAKKAKRVSQETREHALKAGLLANGCIDDADSRIIHYKDKAPAAPSGYTSDLRVLYTAKNTSFGTKTVSTKGTIGKVARHIPTAASRVLDAPELLDDYYCNLVEWGKNNRVAVALGSTVYVWNAADGTICELADVAIQGQEGNYVGAVAWLPGETSAGHLAIGAANGVTELWDVAAERCLRRMDGHSARVSALAWNGHIVTSAGRDANIIHHDVRVRHHAVGSCQGHTQEICGLAYSLDGQTLASGANDNLVHLWSAAATGIRRQAPIRSLADHCAAVKALAWCPHDRNVLATGAGTADRTIKIWNAQLGTMLNSVDTGSQVCALQWNPHEKELLSGHGYANNELALWSYPTMARVKDLKGHDGRILSLGISPDGTTALSAGADETLRFWQCFGDPLVAKKKAKHHLGVHKNNFVNTGRPLSIR